MKKFVFIDSSNRRGESEGYDTTDFIYQFTGNTFEPIKTNASGIIDSSLLPIVSASSLQLTKIAQMTIVQGDAVRAFSDTHVVQASQDSTLEAASVLGVAMNSAIAGQPVTLLVLGIYTLPLFNIFPVNSPLFLDVNGGLSDDRPTTGFKTTVGKSLGNGSIMVQIGEPTQLA
jgi:hypothetical protein